MKGLPRSLKNLYQSLGAGAPAGAGNVADQQGIGALRKTVLRLENFTISLVDEAGVVAHGAAKIFDFPEGAILFHGAVADLAVTKSSAGVNDDWDGDFALGTVAADNDASLAAAEQDLVPTTPTPQASSGATTAKGKSTATESGSVLDGTTTPKDVFLNVLVDDADHDVTTTPCNLIFNGTVTLFWSNLGDV